MFDRISLRLPRALEALCFLRRRVAPCKNDQVGQTATRGAWYSPPMFQPPRFAALLLCLVVAAPEVLAATSPRAVSSPMGGNGHNVSFDGRLFVVRRNAGWEATVLRPQKVTVANGFPDVSQAFSPFTLIQAEVNNENALALCEETPQPVKCDSNGTLNAAGAYACYHLVVIDSDALAPPPNNPFRQRKLRVIVDQPGTATASIASFQWTQPTLTPLTPTLRGLEPTITKDGKLLVWQGLPVNDGKIDTLVYSVNSTACGVSGWSAPRSITAMGTDPLIVGKYKLGDRPLRGADGTVFTSGQLFYGAYPWVFPDGEAINFTAVNMPCRVPAPNEDPPGCGPRRNALSVIGYPTNWQLAHIDGAANPDTDQTVRLFFTSPGPTKAAPLPATTGVDVWPFFGTNTSNYTELVFDDALDGKYAGLWHLNELVTNGGAYDKTRTADSSGYSNTGTLVGGASFPAKNNGLLGKAAVFNGTSSHIDVVHATSLNPVNAITIELAVKPTVDPNCDGNNNYRMLLGKGDIGTGSYSVVLEENLVVQARVRVASGQLYALHSNVPIALNAWSRVAVQYDAASGEMVFLVNGVETNRTTHPPAILAGQADKLTIGGPNGTRAACPNGDGAFQGELDEVAVSRVWRYGAPPAPPDAGVPDAGAPDAGKPDAGGQIADAGTTPDDAGIIPDAGAGGGGGQDGGTATKPVDAGSGASGKVDGAAGCGCAASAALPLWIGLLALATVLARRRRS
jgi:hypothetical protein